MRLTELAPEEGRRARLTWLDREGEWKLSLLRVLDSEEKRRESCGGLKWEREWRERGSHGLKMGSWKLGGMK